MNSNLSVDDEIKLSNQLLPELVLHTAKKVFGSARRGFVLIGPKARKKRDQVEKKII